ncbi:MAG: SAM-dependent methyltransferase [Rhodospirillales bacterium]|nr:SAM-dependent methyltransferase [Rhodospirillales bacterium]
MHKDYPSTMARKIALSIVTLAAKPGMDKVLPCGTMQATEKLLVASGVAGEETIRWCHSQAMVAACEAFDWVIPGQFEAFAYRKAFCERQVRDGIEAAATQILILGAGYDTMGWRLAPEFPDVNIFEIDHLATARLKAKGIEAMGPRDNLFLIPEDLDNQNLGETLKTNKSWDQNARTVIIAEGLVMYLSSQAVGVLFSQCAAVTGGGSRFAFTYIPSGEDGWLDAGRWTGFMLWLQNISGEPWLWSIQPEKLEPFLEKLGWTYDLSLAAAPRKHGVEYFAVATKRT